MAPIALGQLPASAVSGPSHEYSIRGKTGGTSCPNGKAFNGLAANNTFVQRGTGDDVMNYTLTSVLSRTGSARSLSVFTQNHVILSRCDQQ